jgi:hypothetical protein
MHANVGTYPERRHDMVQHGNNDDAATDAEHAGGKPADRPGDDESERKDPEIALRGRVKKIHARS